jgi:hypothetical protein
MEAEIEKAENTIFEFPEGTEVFSNDVSQKKDIQTVVETLSNNSNIIYVIV